MLVAGRTFFASGASHSREAYDGAPSERSESEQKRSDRKRNARHSLKPMDEPRQRAPIAVPANTPRKQTRQPPAPLPVGVRTKGEESGDLRCHDERQDANGRGKKRPKLRGIKTQAVSREIAASRRERCRQ